MEKVKGTLKDSEMKKWRKGKMEGGIEAWRSSGKMDR